MRLSSQTQTRSSDKPDLTALYREIGPAAILAALTARKGAALSTKKQAA